MKRVLTVFFVFFLVNACFSQKISPRIYVIGTDLKDGVTIYKLAMHFALDSLARTVIFDSDTTAVPDTAYSNAGSLAPKDSLAAGVWRERIVFLRSYKDEPIARLRQRARAIWSKLNIKVSKEHYRKWKHYAKSFLAQ